ncbi:uncharacterized protein [Heliangelus exortis]|uniref:uncharacterized protein isoform X2 n=1 Tax=Heliangelus exortis TaxID=472823 RepID=UPI003A8E48DA
MEEELWEHLDGWLSPENPANPSLQLLDETLTPGEQLRVAQLMEDIIQWMGNMSRCGAVELQEGHWVVPPNPHQAEEKAWDVHSQRESNTSLLLAQQHWMEEMMEKLQKVNQSLGLLLVAMEGAQNQLENHLQELHSVLEPSGSSPSAISTCILQGFGVLVGLLVPTPPRAVLLLLLLLLLAFSTLGDLLGIQALTTSLLLSMAGGEWVQGGPWGCYKGGLRVLLPSPTLWPSCRTVSGDCHPSWCSESLASVSLSPTHLHPGEGTRNGAVAGGAGQDGNKLPARALMPGGAPRGGKGPPWLSREGVTHPQWLEDKHDLVWGEARADPGNQKELGAQSLQPKAVHDQRCVLDVPTVPMPGAHQSWAEVQEESHPWAGLLSCPWHQSKLLHGFTTPSLTLYPLPEGFLTLLWLFQMLVNTWWLRTLRVLFNVGMGPCCRADAPHPTSFMLFAYISINAISTYMCSGLPPS